MLTLFNEQGWIAASFGVRGRCSTQRMRKGFVDGLSAKFRTASDWEAILQAVKSGPEFLGSRVASPQTTSGWTAPQPLRRSVVAFSMLYYLTPSGG
jgi:hypothetical protein